MKLEEALPALRAGRSIREIDGETFHPTDIYFEFSQEQVQTGEFEVVDESVWFATYLQRVAGKTWQEYECQIGKQSECDILVPGSERTVPK